MNIVDLNDYPVTVEFSLGGYNEDVVRKLNLPSMSVTLDKTSRAKQEFIAPFNFKECIIHNIWKYGMIYEILIVDEFNRHTRSFQKVEDNKILFKSKIRKGNNIKIIYYKTEKLSDEETKKSNSHLLQLLQEDLKIKLEEENELNHKIETLLQIIKEK